MPQQTSKTPDFRNSEFARWLRSKQPQNGDRTDYGPLGAAITPDQLASMRPTIGPDAVPGVPYAVNTAPRALANPWVTTTPAAYWRKPGQLLQSNNPEDAWGSVRQAQRTLEHREADPVALATERLLTQDGPQNALAYLPQAGVQLAAAFPTAIYNGSRNAMNTTLYGNADDAVPDIKKTGVNAVQLPLMAAGAGATAKAMWTLPSTVRQVTALLPALRSGPALSQLLALSKPAWKALPGYAGRVAGTGADVAVGTTRAVLPPLYYNSMLPSGQVLAAQDWAPTNMQGARELAETTLASTPVLPTAGLAGKVVNAAVIGDTAYHSPDLLRAAGHVTKAGLSAAGDWFTNKALPAVTRTMRQSLPLTVSGAPGMTTGQLLAAPR